MRRLIESDRVPEGELTSFTVDGTKLLATRLGDAFFVCENQCPHLGWSLARGSVDDGMIRCPWHGSRFELASGECRDWANAFAGVPMPSWTHRLLALGRAPAPLRTFHVEVADGWLVTDER